MGACLICTWVQCAGFPFLLPFILLLFYLFGSTGRSPFTRFTPRLLGLSVLIGLLLVINNLLFSWGNSYLPVSTTSLLQSSQLAFTLILCVLTVKQKITFSNLSCVIFLTFGAVLIDLSSNRDRPESLTRSKYFMGLCSTLGLIMEAATTVLATVGMAFNGGFSEVRNESLQEFDLGPAAKWKAFSSYVYGKYVDSVALNHKSIHSSEISNPDMEMEMSQSGSQAAV
ncbi:hypothetical protein RJ641_001602 [Dillenia turbinata]|uniref:Uncharacterized protein n=1 Tax=Dillenia turbinata TaxID=194707 RepID=A0AAN8VQF4_9MAGN